MREKIKANTQLVNTRNADYLDGFAAGRNSREYCETESDVNWYIGVAYGNLWDSKPHYVAGYLDGITSR